MDFVTIEQIQVIQFPWMDDDAKQTYCILHLYSLSFFKGLRKKAILYLQPQNMLLLLREL